MENLSQVIRRIAAAMLACLLFTARPGNAAELKQSTLDGFERYARLSEAGNNIAVEADRPFLWVDRLPESRRNDLLAQLRRGEVVIEKLETLDGGKPVEARGGLIHHWIGAVFIPGATLEETLALEQDYDRHQEEFRPDVVRSKILRRNGNDFLVYLRFRKHRVLTAILDTEHRVHYDLLGPTRAASRSWTTRIQQVDNAGEPGERLRRVGEDDGYLWRMNTYWRFEEKDGGTYVECQSISLTRDVPVAIAWLVRPFVLSIPRESLNFTLSTTRQLLLNRGASRKRGVFP